MTTTTTTTTTTTPEQATTTAPTMSAATALERVQKSLTRSSLSDLARSTRRSMLLADVSASMHATIASGERRIDALRTVVETLRATHPIPVAAFGFSRRPGRVRIVQDIPGSHSSPFPM